MINANGCIQSSTDFDGDGVNDGVDLCPGTTGVEVNGESHSHPGCPLFDWDGDGINNPSDGCDDLLRITTLNYQGAATWTTRLAGVTTCSAENIPENVSSGGCSPENIDVQLLDRGEQQGGCSGNQVATAVIVKKEDGVSTLSVQCAEVVVSCQND